MRQVAIRILICCIVLVSVVLSSAYAGNYRLDWTVVSSGGGDGVSSSYKLQCTVGQPCAGFSYNTSLLHWIGFWSTVPVPVFSATTSTAKSFADGTLLSIPGSIATSANGDFGEYFYMEAQDKAAGIRVATPPSDVPYLVRGSEVIVVGMMDSTPDGERHLIGSVVTVLGNHPAPASSISGTVTYRENQLVGRETSQIVQSPHDYPNDYEHNWQITGPAGTTRMRVHFVRISLQNECDYLCVSNPAYSEVEVLTGDSDDLWSGWVTGPTVMLDMSSDAEVTGYGFYMDKYEAELPILASVPMSGVTLYLSPDGTTCITDSSGAFSFTGLVAGDYAITPSLAGATFDPSAQSLSIVEGQSSTGNDFVRN